jgi:hypothetical protein
MKTEKSDASLFNEMWLLAGLRFDSIHSLSEISKTPDHKTLPALSHPGGRSSRRVRW